MKEKQPQATVEVSRDSFLDFLRGRSFGREFKSILANSSEYEQGCVIGWDRKRQKYCIGHPTGAQERSFQSGEVDYSFSIEGIFPVFTMHSHPISAMQWNAFAPSERDFVPLPPNDFGFFPGYRIFSVEAMIIPTRDPQVWLWQSVQPEERKLVRSLYHQWDNGLAGKIRWNDLDNLEQMLTTQAHMHIVRGVLPKGNEGASFTQLFALGNFRIGVEKLPSRSL